MRTYSSFRGRTLAGLLTALLLSAAPLACRKPAQPSEAYAQAHTRFGKLYAAKGDDAFVDPELAEVESLLAQVPADSLDAAAANELRARINAGKQLAAARDQAKADVLEQIREPGTMPADSTAAARAAEPPSNVETPEAAVDAGTDAGTAGAPGIGTPVSELASAFSGCFQKGEQLEVKGRGPRDRWELADRLACRQQYGQLQDQLLIVEDGKVLGMVPRSAIQEIPSDGGTTGSTPDGGR
ncbi:hypothetical protein JQX13_41525 [Archangium violaceum]|uniref:hypothetical protein n=1 Tax=Archangium violaceum TaxID=83451 RepID=UPI00193C43D3|nr:hypothetical protein [Archangium violaceum]QRK06512.1 hypothetical protein JQX13_41525 [Archangium violaceum]